MARKRAKAAEIARLSKLGLERVMVLRTVTQATAHNCPGCDPQLPIWAGSWAVSHGQLALGGP